LRAFAVRCAVASGILLREGLRAMNGTVVQMPIESLRKWHGLAERRRRHYVELYRSDRWRRHYTEEAFAALMRDVIQNVETWGKVLESALDTANHKAARH
jgi:hypothetical protein